VVDLERVGLTTAAVQRGHQQLRATLSQGVGPYQSFQL
jgi:hypothetical protein